MLYLNIFQRPTKINWYGLLTICGGGLVAIHLLGSQGVLNGKLILMTMLVVLVAYSKQKVLINRWFKLILLWVGGDALFMVMVKKSLLSSNYLEQYEVCAFFIIFLLLMTPFFRHNVSHIANYMVKAATYTIWLYIGGYIAFIGLTFIKYKSLEEIRSIYYLVFVMSLYTVQYFIGEILVKVFKEKIMGITSKLNKMDRVTSKLRLVMSYTELSEAIYGTSYNGVLKNINIWCYKNNDGWDSLNGQSPLISNELILMLRSKETIQLNNLIYDYENIKKSRKKLH